jgi:hypothetical protein
MTYRGVSSVLVAFLCLSLALAPASALADEPVERNTAATYGLGVGSAICSLVYGPVKIVYATLGAITGGLAWALTGGRSDVASAVIEASMRGDYVVTPEHLTFNRPLSFTGRDRPLDEQASAEQYE